MPRDLAPREEQQLAEQKALAVQFVKISQRAHRIEELVLSADDDEDQGDEAKELRAAGRCSFADLPAKVRIAHELVKAERAARAEQQRPVAVIGLVLVPPRASSDAEWEAEAQRVDEDERNAIDTTAEPVEGSTKP